MRGVLSTKPFPTEADNEEVIETHVTDRDRDKNIRERVEHEKQRRYSKRKQKPEKGDYCDIIVSG